MPHKTTTAVAVITPGAEATASSSVDTRFPPLATYDAMCRLQLSANARDDFRAQLHGMTSRKGRARVMLHGGGLHPARVRWTPIVRQPEPSSKV